MISTSDFAYSKIRADMTEQRRDLGYGEKHDLPSRFWEPEPDEEDLERMAQEYEGSELDDEPLPFE